MHRCPTCHRFCCCSSWEDDGGDAPHCDHCDESTVDEELLYDDAIGI